MLRMARDKAKQVGLTPSDGWDETIMPWVGDRIVVIEGDITRQRVDAIVNAANMTLLGGGGVDGAIHRAAGPELLEACRQLGGCPTGSACITPGYRLPARWVIHAVGPIWRGGSREEADLLASCYRYCFSIADRYRMRTIAFPSISTGAYGFPLEPAAHIAVTETLRALQANPTIERVVFVCFSRQVFDAYTAALAGARTDHAGASGSS